MKRSFKGLLAVVIGGVLSPMALAAAPTTMPAQSRVEIFAFTPINKSDAGDWIGRGIQENLQSDVSHTGATLVMPQHADGTTPDALAEAKQNHADLAVIGTYQVVGNQIRVNGNLVDVATNTSLGGFSATGQQTDIFKVEDALGEQFRNLLPRPMTTDQMAQAVIEPPIPPVIQQPVQNGYYSSPPTVTYDGSSAAPVYVEPSYPDYYYDSYPFGFYGGLGFYSGGHYGDYRYHGRGDVGRSFSHGFSGRPGLSPNPTFHNPVYHGGSGFTGPHIGGAGGGHGGFGGGGGHAGGGGHR